MRLHMCNVLQDENFTYHVLNNSNIIYTQSISTADSQTNITYEGCTDLLTVFVTLAFSTCMLVVHFMASKLKKRLLDKKLTHVD